MRTVKHWIGNPGRLEGPWRLLRSASSPGQPDHQSLPSLLLLVRSRVESCQVLSNLNGPQVPLTALRSCRLGSYHPQSIPPDPKLWFLSHKCVCAAVLGLGCCQLAISKGPLLLAFPSSMLACSYCDHSWSCSPLQLCLFSSSQEAWKEKRKLQSCWFLMGTLLRMLLADSSRNQQVCAVQLLVQVITSSATPATAGLSLTPSKSTPSMLAFHRGHSLPTKMEGNITASSSLCSVLPESTSSKLGTPSPSSSCWLRYFWGDYQTWNHSHSQGIVSSVPSPRLSKAGPQMCPFGHTQRVTDPSPLLSSSYFLSHLKFSLPQVFLSGGAFYMAALCFF